MATVPSAAADVPATVPGEMRVCQRSGKHAQASQALPLAHGRLTADRHARSKRQRTWPRYHLKSLTVTPLPHTFDGFTIQCMGGVCGDPLTLPAVSCETRSKVMEMDEHSPSWWKPAKLPIICCERPLSHLGAWLAYGAVWWEWAVRSGGLQ